MSGLGAGQLWLQAWELRDGKLVPLEGNGAGAGGPLNGVMQPRDLEKLFENFPNKNLILPGLPEQLESLQDERSELEDTLKKLETDKKDRDDQLKQMQQKLRELQDKLQDS